MIKYLISAVLIFSSPVSFYAQNIGGIEDEAISENIPTESLLNLTVTPLIMDSVAVIPYFNEYAEWNTSKVHPYDVDLTKMTDTIPLVLTHSDCDYAHSVCGEINSEFGYRRNRFHYGIDVDLNVGDDVLASFEGIVRIAKYDPTYGRVVVIRHQNGLETLYAHLSKFKVEVGDYVQAGDLIALGGNSGRSTGPHLHFEVRYLGEPINPNDIIDFQEGRLKMDEVQLSEENFAYLKEIRKRKYYKVRSGDSLSRIAVNKGVTISKLCSLNGISRNSILRIGQSIRYN
jgi:murein DD-endopeptidase MepM/ murein hydrolase activator NlpD